MADYEAFQESLQTLHSLLVEDLLKKIKSGEAKPADLAVALKVLQHNNIQCLPEADGKLLELADKLPFKQIEAPQQWVLQEAV